MYILHGKKIALKTPYFFDIHINLTIFQHSFYVFKYSEKSEVKPITEDCTTED